MICNGPGGSSFRLSSSSFFVCSSSCLSQGCERDPPYPLLVGSPSLLTPFEDREDGYAARRGRWGFLSRLLGLVIAKPYSPRGLALSSFCSVVRADIALFRVICLCWFCCFCFVALLLCVVCFLGFRSSSIARSLVFLRE